MQFRSRSYYDTTSSHIFAKYTHSPKPHGPILMNGFAQTLIPPGHLLRDSEGRGLNALRITHLENKSAQARLQLGAGAIGALE
jgi:hypothetical protein